MPTNVTRRGFLRAGIAAGAGLSVGVVPTREVVSAAPAPGPGPVGFTSFIHPTARLATRDFSIGAASIIDAFVSLEGDAARIGNAVNLQDNDRLLDFKDGRRVEPGDLAIGDGTFTAHGVTFIGTVRIGQACGTGINAVVQNARVGDASFTGLVARIFGSHPGVLIEIPEASLVLFGARITSQADVAANIIPVPAPFSLFFADVDEENLVLARGFNLLFRAAARRTPFSAAVGDPRNPGASFPGVEEAFGKLSVAPPTIYRRGTGVLPARQATLGDLGFDRFEPLAPVPTPSTPPDDAGGLGLNAPPSGSPAAGARFVVPRVASPELLAPDAIVLGGCELAAGVSVQGGSYVLGDVASALSVGAGTRIGRHSSLHELTFTSCRVGANCVIGDHVVLHGPVEVGNNVRVGNRAVLFGPRVADNVTIGAGALVFGPVDITSDVPPNSIVVPPGSEFLIAPSAPVARGTRPRSPGMLAQWRRAQDAGRGCGCGLGALVLVA